MQVLCHADNETEQVLNQEHQRLVSSRGKLGVVEREIFLDNLQVRVHLITENE